MATTLFEPYAVTSLRNDVRDSLMMAGEECIALSLFHPEVDKDQPRCPNCDDDVYASGEGDCTICYGTSVKGGVKEAKKIWALYSDHLVSENFIQNRGMFAPDVREIQLESSPLLMEHDVVVRVRQWGANHRPTELEGYYAVKDVTRTSLRTGSAFGQYRHDVVGQRAAVVRLPENQPVYQYPVLGVNFSRPVISRADIPLVFGPDSNVIFLPAEGAAPPVFTHIQSLPDTVWTITHPFHHRPSVTIIVNNQEVTADVSYVDSETVKITFGEPQVGIAVLI